VADWRRQLLPGDPVEACLAAGGLGQLKISWAGWARKAED
jgi:hypothetical protein